MPYVGTQFSKYTNRLLLPSMIPADDYKGAFGFEVQDFYEIRDQYVTPMLPFGRGYPFTADAITALYCIKTREDTDFQTMGLMFNCLASTVDRWFNRVTDSIYTRYKEILKLYSDNNIGPLHLAFHQYSD